MFPHVLEGFAKRLRGVDPGRALLQLLSSRSHIGDVEIDARASGFQMKASREGFITHTAVDELKRLTRFLIDWATVYRDYFLRLIDKDESQTVRAIEEQLHTHVEPERVVAIAVNGCQIRRPCASAWNYGRTTGIMQQENRLAV